MELSIDADTAERLARGMLSFIALIAWCRWRATRHVLGRGISNTQIIFKTRFGSCTILVANLLRDNCERASDQFCGYPFDQVQKSRMVALAQCDQQNNK